MSVSNHGNDKAALITRLNRVDGQVRAISRMIEQDAYCLDVLTQLSAASHALQSVGLILIDQHLRHCVADATAAASEFPPGTLDELSAVIALLARS